MEFITWLNSNQGAMLSVLTLVYVVATVAIVIVMMRANSLSHKSIVQTQELENERKRPQVIFDFIFDDSCVFAELRNEGLTSAKNISIEISPELNTDQRNKPCAFSSNELSYLAPNRSTKDFIAVGYHFFQKHEDPRFEIKLNYEDVSGQKYSETIFHDLSYRKDVIGIGKNDTGKELEKLRKEFEKFRRDFTGLGKKLITLQEQRLPSSTNEDQEQLNRH